jgi:hypothetical protein
MSLGRVIPVTLGFLARLIGLGGIAQKIKTLLKRFVFTYCLGVERVKLLENTMPIGFAYCFMSVRIKTITKSESVSGNLSTKHLRKLSVL